MSHKNNNRFAKFRLEMTENQIVEYSHDILENKYPGDGFCYKRLAQELANKAFYSWYVNNDLKAAKQWFYVAGKCVAKGAKQAKRFVTLWTCHDFMFPLLSDSTELIQEFSTLSPLEFNTKKLDPLQGEFQSYLVQTAISKNDELLRELIQLYDKKADRSQNKIANQYVQFYRGLLNADIAEMEKALQILGQFKSQDSITEDFLAFHAVVMCKLAWLRSYEVKVNSPLVPMEFMPMQPLAHYDEIYAFLKPDWIVPLPAVTSASDIHTNQSGLDFLKKWLNR